MLFLADRQGALHELSHGPGETAAQTLLRHGVPPTSVLIFRDDRGSVVADDTVLSADVFYTAQLIEAYDLATVRELYAPELDEPDQVPSDQRAFLKRRLAVTPSGSLAMERARLGRNDVARHVEETVHETIERFSLLGPDSSMVLGLSGGVDSGSLLMLLAGYRDQCTHSPPTVRAATFRDFDRQYSETFDFASELADRFRVEHYALDADSAERVFHLTRPVAQVLTRLMETEDAHLAMYVDHHTTRRVLEVFADETGTTNVALGLHTTDLLAGLMNSWSTGHDIGPAPERRVGEYRYILPLTFVPKRELHLYYTARAGHRPKQTSPNEWEFTPTDRNFYYFLADHLEWLWPGVSHWTITAHAARAPAPLFQTCENCGASVRMAADASSWSGLCDVCLLLDRHGWIRT